MQDIIINSPSLDPTKNVSGISAVVQFIIGKNKSCNYIHFEVGRTDEDKGGLGRIFSIFGSLKKWKALLKVNPQAIVHYNYALTKVCIIRDSLYLHFCKGNRSVVHLHGGNYLFEDHLPFYIEWLLKRLFRKNIPFVVLSDKEKQRLEDKYKAQNVISLPNCIDLEDAAQLEKQYNTEQPTLGYIGRIASTKGMNELLDACVMLKNDNVPFKLVIAGSEREGDTYVSRFQELLGDRFEYMGIVSGAEKTEFFKKVDVFVLPTYFEGLPMSLLETMSFGCIPVTTDVGSINTVVKEGKNGLFLKLKDSQDVAEKVKLLINTEGLMEKLGKSAKETIFEQFNPDKYITVLNSIYQSL